MQLVGRHGCTDGSKRIKMGEQAQCNIAGQIRCST
jgi:hypothetical protein